MKYSARVISGKGRGHRIGFPTLNLEIPHPFPYAHGIYAGWVWVDDKKHPGAFHFGPIPTFKEDTISLEVFLIDTQLVKAPAVIEFEFVQHLRAIRSFSNPEELAAQISKDAKEAKTILGN